MECQPCGKHFSGPASYQQHLESEKHKRKIATSSILQSGTENSVPSKPVGAYNQLHCPACDISFDSVACFQSHSLTLQHVSNVRKELLDKAIHSSNIGAVSSTTSSNDWDTSSKNKVLSEETDAILPSAQCFESANFLLECKICNKQFSGPEPYKQHLASIVHKKKVDMENFISNQTKKIENIFERFVCDPCKKVFSGQVPYLQHINSELHRKKLRSVELMKQLDGIKKSETVMECDFTSVDQCKKLNIDALENMDINHPWFCKVCRIQCSGLVSFNQHLQGGNHSKKLKRSELVKFHLEPELFKPVPVAALMPTTITKDHTVTPGNETVRDSENDFLLPQSFQNLSVLSVTDLNLKEFLPDEKINFDNCENEQSEELIKNESNAKIDVDSSQNKQHDDTINEKSRIQEKNEVYQECVLCKVELMSKDEALSHFESIEHVQKKYGKEINQKCLLTPD